MAKEIQTNANRNVKQKKKSHMNGHFSSQQTAVTNNNATCPDSYLLKKNTEGILHRHQNIHRHRL